ncbi:hypothetical protein HS088_TW21G00964 [Tripterygium wilfordii]|uniref:Transmembrane protein n=1 Tax=Tripterygium wilfordii TaxID=458696 RepID=A0A7J7C3U0_TRIWF|nr:uncharacterized protein LOC119989845 [Tripterygium wilfordii]KAF5728810.1 hypothetical protein HS088_TW21G00964 [Tripterygium wilfordii]
MGSTTVTHLVLMIFILASNYMEIAAQTGSSDSPPPGTQPILHSDNTVRVDPLDGFKKYRGGYDITNKHYWSSTIFTGVHGYTIGILWLFFGVVYGCFVLATKFCSKRKEKLKRSSLCFKQCYLRPVLLATFFTLLGIAASGLVLGSNAKFHSQAKAVVNLVIETANEASETIYNTTGAMKYIASDLVNTSTYEASEASGFLTSTSERLDVEAADIQREAQKNRRLIDKGLKIIYVVTMVTISLNLVAAIALSVTGILRLRRALYLLMILCWLLTVLCWLLFGMYFFVGKFLSDTCIAIENFHENPYNSSLSSILPCDKLLSAKPVLSDISRGIYGLVNQVNANISVQAASYPTVCNPFSAPPEYEYQPNNCPPNTIQIGDIPQVVKVFTCSGADNGTCNDGEFITYSDYKTVEAYTSSIQNLLNVYPSMEDLIECQSVKDAFSEILHKHCKPLKKYVSMVWVAMVVLSVIMVVLVLILTAQASHEQETHSSGGSVKPHPTTTELVKDDSNSSSV